jgi:hypothetical protein
MVQHIGMTSLHPHQCYWNMLIVSWLSRRVNMKVQCRINTTQSPALWLVDANVEALNGSAVSQCPKTGVLALEHAVQRRVFAGTGRRYLFIVGHGQIIVELGRR